jgi:single-strand DNA-binding protein
MLKGQQVLVEGEISLNTFQKNDGSTGASLRVFVQNVELIGGKRESEGTQEQRPQQRPAQQQRDNFDEDGFEDCPF